VLDLRRTRGLLRALDAAQRILEELLVRLEEFLLISEGSGSALLDWRRVVA
jgi:hypothetical protein